MAQRLSAWTLVILALSLGGCAQWQSMTPAQRKLVWVPIAAAAVGAAAAHDTTDVTNVYNSTTVVKTPSTPAPHDCRGRCD